MTDRDQSGIIDPDRTACLCAAGQPDYLAATVIDPDGAARARLGRSRRPQRSDRPL